MNCQSCNTSIDYHFLKNCPHCDFEVECGQPVGVVRVLPSAGSVEKVRTRKRFLITLTYILANSFAGMITVSVVVFFAGQWVYLTFFDDPRGGCGRGMVIGLLLILSGVFLGTMAGCAFAMKHPIYKES